MRRSARLPLGPGGGARGRGLGAGRPAGPGHRRGPHHGRRAPVPALRPEPGRGPRPGHRRRAGRAGATGTSTRSRCRCRPRSAATAARSAPHDPLLPVLLAVPMGLGGWAGAKAALAVLAGVLAALLVWTAQRRFAVPVAVAAGTVLAFGVTAPLTAYATQVYPELPAALAVTVAIAALTGRRSRRDLVVCGLAVVALPWLGVKYAPVAAALAAVAVWYLVGEGRRRGARPRRWPGGCGRGLPGGPPGPVRRVDGVRGRRPLRRRRADGDGRRPRPHRADPPAGRPAARPGLRPGGLDAGLPAGRCRRWRCSSGDARRGGPLLVLPLAAGWATATWVALTMHGWWWPGRQVVVVVPCLVLAVAWWVARARAARWLRGGGRGVRGPGLGLAGGRGARPAAHADRRLRGTPTRCTGPGTRSCPTTGRPASTTGPSRRCGCWCWRRRWPGRCGSGRRAGGQA